MSDDLRSGTQGGGPPMPDTDRGGTGGTTSAGSPAGTSHDTGSQGGRGRGTRNDTDADAEEVFDADRHRSPDEAKQFGRDGADVGTRPGSPHGAGEPRAQQIDPAGNNG